MSSTGKIVLIVASVLVVLIMFGGCTYYNIHNNIVGLNENVEEAWSNVETQYQRRYDLIPNLVKTVKGSAEFEQETLTGVIEARSNATSINLDVNDLTPENIQKFEAAQQNLNSALSKLLVTVERYPDLKTTKAFQDLMIQLEGTENRITKARQDFNETVKRYNASIKKVPGKWFAAGWGFEPKGYFEAVNEGTENAPEVSF